MSGRGRPGTGATGGHSRNYSQARIAKQAELSSAYSALAAELTKKEIKAVGGYTLGRIIGEGTFGKVRLGVHRLTGTRVAIKQVPKSLPSNSSDPSSPLSLLTREIHHHRRLRHPHVLSLYELIATESSIYLVTELCAGGELFDYLVEKGRLSLSETRRILGQLVLGVAYLHGQGVVHRDLKLENVLLDERVNVKIADLGFGREFEKGKWMETWVGTLGYCAPEVVAGKKYFGEEVDIWSLGVIFYALVTGSLPFDDDDESVMKDLILKCEYEVPNWLDPDAADLIRNLLVLDPLRRFSLKQILSHAFFTRPSPNLTRRPTFSRSHSVSSSISSSQHLTSNSRQLSSSHLHHSAQPSNDLEHLQSSRTETILEQEEGSSTRPGTAQNSSRGSSISSPRVGFLGREDRSSSPPPPSDDPTSATRGREKSGEGGDTSDVTSQSSYFESQARTETSSPLTSADGGEEETEEFMSTVKVGKGRAVESEGTEGTVESIIPRNESQSTLRLGAQVSSTERSKLPTNVEETIPGSPTLRSAPPSPLPPSRSSFDNNTPSLRRNMSTSSSIHSLPFSNSHGTSTPHARTPARTKRRSIGSIISERLVSLVEEEQQGQDSFHPASPSQYLPPVDYLSLMLVESERESPTSLPSERELLEQLTTLGFDTGQMVHSITTSACDSASATWWMLKRKMDEKEAARIEHEAVSANLSGAATGNKVLSRTSSIASARSRSRGRSANNVLSEDVVLEIPERLERDEEEPTPSNNVFSSAPEPRPQPRSTPSPRPTVPAPSKDIVDDRLDYFLGQHSSGAPAKTPDYFPTIDPGSPTRRRTRSRDELTLSPRSGSTALAPLDSPLELSPSRAKNEEEGKNRRSRSGSVTLLARATSAIGSSLNLKMKDDSGSGGSGEDAPPSLSTNLFRRRSSIPNLDQTNGSNRTPPISLPSSPTRNHSNSPFRDPATPPRPVSKLPVVSPAPSPAVSMTESTDTFDTITSSTSSGRPRPASANVPVNGTGSGKKGTKGSQLLANLKFWFGDGQRKRNKRASHTNESNSFGSNSHGGGSSAVSLGRSHSLNGTYRGGLAAQGGYVASPLRRPLPGSRRSSNASIAPLSRRSSVSSAHRLTLHDQLARPQLAHHRRRSDGSRTSNSGGEHSRPQSLRSFTGLSPQTTMEAPGSVRRNRHSKAPSTSSAGSFGKDAVYRRPPTTTTVRRRHPSHGRHNHRRTASGASSIRTHRSSTSSMGEGGSDDEAFDEGGEDPILEEDETEDRDTRGDEQGVDEATKAEARLRALRTLSGDYSKLAPPASASSSLSSSPVLGSSVPLSRPALQHHSSSRASSRSDSSSLSRAHSAHATFSAHKSTHLFGSPLQAHSHPAARKTIPPPRPPLRDVFASKSTIGGDSEWIDEDELDGYGGGLGQSGTTTNDSVMSLGTVEEGPVTASVGLGNSPVAEKTFPGGGGMSLFEGRYAGMGSSATTNTAGRGVRTTSTARTTVVIEEEEEEEE